MLVGIVFKILAFIVLILFTIANVLAVISGVTIPKSLILLISLCGMLSSIFVVMIPLL